MSPQGSNNETSKQYATTASSGQATPLDRPSASSARHGCRCWFSQCRLTSHRRKARWKDTTCPKDGVSRPVRHCMLRQFLSPTFHRHLARQFHGFFCWLACTPPACRPPSLDSLSVRVHKKNVETSSNSRDWLVHCGVSTCTFSLCGCRWFLFCGLLVLPLLSVQMLFFFQGCCFSRLVPSLAGIPPMFLKFSCLCAFVSSFFHFDSWTLALNPNPNLAISR